MDTARSSQAGVSVLVFTIASCDAQEVHKVWCISIGIQEEDMLAVWVTSNVQQLRKINIPHSNCEYLQTKNIPAITIDTTE